MSDNKYKVALSLEFNDKARYIVSRIHAPDFQEIMKKHAPDASMTVTEKGIELEMRRIEFLRMRATGVIPKALSEVFDTANQKMAETDNARKSFFSKLLEAVRYTPGVPLSTTRAESKEVPGLKASVKRFDL